MKRSIVGVALCAFVILTSGARLYRHYVPEPVAAPSPTHVVSVYVDGLNHMDYRQTCTAVYAPIAFPTMSKCEGYFAFNTAMAGQSIFRVIPHSAKVWWDTYRGRRIHLAVVKFANLTNPFVLTAHLRWIDGAWRIVGVSA